MPWIGFIFLMGHMSLNHIIRQSINNPSAVDITGAQMVMVMKLTGFCWNVADGREPEKNLSDAQKEKAIKQLPKLLDYAGYVLFFPSLMAGPAFDYVEYKRWIETTMFEVPAGVDPSKRAPTRKKRKIPRSGTPAAVKAAKGLIWILVFLKASSWYYPDILTDDSYMNHGFLKRVWLLHMVGFTTRTKYYGVWFLTEGSCILSGLGYNGVDAITGRVSWNRLKNVDPWGVESAQNTRAYLGSWNINTNNWLRNYMYLRVTPRGKKPGFRASMATFVTSAFWHGFYPGYYLAFVLASFVQTIAKSKPLVSCYFVLWTYSITQALKLFDFALTLTRFPPLRQAVCLGRSNTTTYPLQNILRYLLLPCNSGRIFFRRRTFLSPHFSCVLPRLEPRIFLRCDRCCSHNRVLLLSSQGLSHQDSKSKNGCRVEEKSKPREFGR